MTDEPDAPAAPQNPGDPGYEPPEIQSELDGKGGTTFKLGDEEFASREEAEEARQALVSEHAEASAPEEVEVESEE